MLDEQVELNMFNRTVKFGDGLKKILQDNDVFKQDKQVFVQQENGYWAFGPRYAIKNFLTGDEILVHSTIKEGNKSEAIFEEKDGRYMLTIYYEDDIKLPVIKYMVNILKGFFDKNYSPWTM